MVFFGAERGKEATGRSRKALELVSTGLGKPHGDLKARPLVGLVWIQGTAPMVSARQHTSSAKSLLTPK